METVLFLLLQLAPIASTSPLLYGNTNALVHSHGTGRTHARPSALAEWVLEDSHSSRTSLIQMENSTLLIQLARSFRVSAADPCSLTIANQQKRGGVRLSFGEQTGATLTRVQYPMTTTPVCLAQGFYDVQASDDLLIFQFGSVTNSTAMATFKWSPSPL